MERIFEINDNFILLMRDESRFHLNGMLNQLKDCHWALKTPRELHKRPLHSPTLKVWSTVGKAVVIGSYFFENYNENAVTLNSESYVKMINNLE